MKVLFITHYSGFYGANRSLLQLIIELRENFLVQPTVIVPKEGEFVAELKKNNIPILMFKYYNWLNGERSYLKSIIKKGLNFYCFREIKNCLIKKNDFKFDIIHTNSSATNLGGVLSKYLKVPHLWQIREYGCLDYNLVYYDGIRRATPFIEENSSFIVVISEDLKKYYSKYIDSNKLKVIYNGIKIPTPIVKQKESEILNLCFVGAISENKNQIEAIKACKYLKEELKVENFIMHIIGDGDKSYLKSLKQYVFDNGLEHKIKFVGYLNDINQFLNKMDVGLVCSKKEAFGRVTIEYMMHKMPVIASNTGANSELIKDCFNGFLYQYGDFKELASKIKKFYNNRDLIESIGESGYNNAIEKYSSEKNTSSIFAVYRKLLS